MSMVMLYKRSVKAQDLPAKWREEGRFAPDDRVTVVITTESRKEGASPKRFVGAGQGLFGSGGDVDAYLRRQRDAWKS